MKRRVTPTTKAEREAYGAAVEPTRKVAFTEYKRIGYSDAPEGRIARAEKARMAKELMRKTRAALAALNAERGAR